MLEMFALLIIGLSAGLLAGLLGIGGGLVIVPAVTALLGARGLAVEVAVPIAVATALASMLLTSAGSALAHARSAAMDWAAVARLAPALALGAVGGAWLATGLGGVVLARVFAAITALIGLRMLLGRNERRHAIAPRPRGWWWAGPGIGAVSAMIGIGGGSFNVPYLMRNGYSTIQAVAIAAACGWAIALAGSAGFVVRGHAQDSLPGMFGYLYLPGVVLIGIGGLVAAPLGVRLAHRLGSIRLARVFGAFLLLVAVHMALQ